MLLQMVVDRLLTLLRDILDHFLVLLFRIGAQDKLLCRLFLLLFIVIVDRAFGGRWSIVQFEDVRHAELLLMLLNVFNFDQ